MNDGITELSKGKWIYYNKEEDMYYLCIDMVCNIVIPLTKEELQKIKGI